jgi:hypothetical protein
MTKRIMKTFYLLLIGLCLGVWTPLWALADGTPGYPASQAAVNAGTDTYGWVTPATLNAWVAFGTTNGITAVQVSNLVAGGTFNFAGNGAGLTNIPNVLTNHYVNAVTLPNSGNSFTGTFTGNGGNLTGLYDFNILGAINNNYAIGGGLSTESGLDNSAYGYDSMFAGLSASYDAALGTFALQVNTNVNNTAVGYNAEGSNTNGRNNTAVGANALANDVNGSNNVALGNGAGLNIVDTGGNLDIDNAGQLGDSGIGRIGTSEVSMYFAGILYGSSALTNASQALPTNTNTLVSAAQAYTIASQFAGGGGSMAGDIGGTTGANKISATGTNDIIGIIASQVLQLSGTNNQNPPYFLQVWVAAGVTNVALSTNGTGLSFSANYAAPGTTLPNANLPATISVVTVDSSSGIQNNGGFGITSFGGAITNGYTGGPISSAGGFQTTAGSVYNGNGSGLTSLNGSQVTSGTVPVAQLPVATTSALGVVKPDGSTITIASGVISSTGGANFNQLPGITNNGTGGNGIFSNAFASLLDGVYNNNNWTNNGGEAQLGSSATNYWQGQSNTFTGALYASNLDQQVYVAGANQYAVSLSGTTLAWTNNGINWTNISSTNLLFYQSIPAYVLSTQYVNNSNAPIVLEADTVLTQAAVAGYVSCDLCIPGHYTNYMGAHNTTTSSIAGATTNHICQIIAPGATYYFTNLSTGSGNAGALLGNFQLTPL